MSNRTLILAAAAALSLGAGSAFAATGGSNDGSRVPMVPQNTQTVQQAPNQYYGQTASQPTTPVYHYVPDWIQRTQVMGGD